ncbi:hypothetical protein ACHAW5_006650 [Stephanodiscus triporus]|uniref:Uncharacterized protein n=1 Tax=Stephanodiscus triporus TaxID=2934178 RepID=A0ABD3N613_9STRA
MDALNIAKSFLPYGDLVAENNGLDAENDRLVGENAKLVAEKSELVQEKHRLYTENITLRGGADEAKIALVAVKNKAGEDEEKYFDLVWIARGRGRGDHPSPLAAKYPVEIAKIKGEHGDWEHGFNSGMLAASRMYMGLSVSTEEETHPDDSDEDGEFVEERLAARRRFALEEFPELDS